MITAIYVRKSTDQSDRSEDAKSVTRQIESGRAFAAEHRWTVAEEHVYVDEAVSGAEFERRPGLQALLNALKPRSPFQALVVMDKDRLGREMYDALPILKRLSEAGVRVFEYLKGREVLLDTPTNKLIQSIEFYAAETERDQASRRTRAALVSKARAGHVTGGRVYGYANTPVNSPDGKRLHVTRVVNEAEAWVVRRIFERCAAGAGYRQIAHELNAAGCLAPRPRDGQPRGWCSSTVRDVLHRDDYRGVLIWGKTKKRDAWGRRQTSRSQRGTPSDDWVRVEAPRLRIVSDELWQTAHERLHRARHIYERGTGGKLHGKPANGIESKYLLTGLALCSLCGGALTIRSRNHGARRAFFYECLTHVQRGPAVCANSMAMPMAAVDDAVLAAIESTVLRADVVAAAIDEAASTLQPDPAQHASQRQRLQAELARARGELTRLGEAIASGSGASLPSLVAAVEERERRREGLEHELATLDQLAQVGQLDSVRLRRVLGAKLNDWRGLLRRHVQEARRILAMLLDGRLRFAPTEDGEGRYYVFEGASRVEPILEGVVNPLPKALVAPRGYARKAVNLLVLPFEALALAA